MQGVQAAQGSTGPSNQINVSNVSSGGYYVVGVGAVGSNQTPVAYANPSTINIQISNDGQLIAAAHSLWSESTFVPPNGLGKSAGTDVYLSNTTGHIILFTPTGYGSQALSLGVNTTPSNTAGEIRASNEITAYYSDRRLKENVKIVDNAMNKVLKLTGITYTPNALAESYGYDRTKKLVGLFADEVEAVLPEAVRPAPFDDNGSGNSKSGENYLTIQYEKLIPLLIEAIKELKEEIEILKKK